MLSDDVIVKALASLDIKDLLSVVRTSRSFKDLVNANPHVCESALFDVDPFAVLGPTGVVSALRTGLPILTLLNRLGDSRCAKCRAVGAINFDPGALKRVCNRSSCMQSRFSVDISLLNRFFYTSKSANTCTKVSTEEQLDQAIQMLQAHQTWTVAHMSTIVVTKSLVLSRTLALMFPLKLCGAHEGITLTCRNGPVVMTWGKLYLEDIRLVSGKPFEHAWDAFFPAVELCIWNDDGGGNSLWIPRGCLLMRNTHVEAHQGSAIMNDSGLLSVDQCSAYSPCFFGIISKSKKMPGSLAFLLSARRCRFTGSKWHISSGADLSDSDVAALETANEFVDGVVTCENVTRSMVEYVGGCVQPWRPDCLFT